MVHGVLDSVGGLLFSITMEFICSTFAENISRHSKYYYLSKKKKRKKTNTTYYPQNGDGKTVLTMNKREA